MILQCSRISHSSGVDLLARHLLDKNDENQRIAVLIGDRAALYDGQALANAKGCRYSIRHLSISPERRMDKAELAWLLRAVDEEFGIGQARPRLLVMHEKDGRTHFHLAVAEVDPNTLRVLSCRNDFARLERIAREYEKTYNETIQLTRSARRVALVVGLSSKARMRAERIQPKFNRTALRQAWQCSPSALSAECKRQGLCVASGEKAFIFTTIDGAFVVAAHRAVGAKKGEFASSWTAFQHDRTSKLAGHSADHAIQQDKSAARERDRKKPSHSSIAVYMKRPTINAISGGRYSRSGMVKTSADTVDIDRALAYLDGLLLRSGIAADAIFSPFILDKRQRLLTAIKAAKVKSKRADDEFEEIADQLTYRMKR